MLIFYSGKKLSILTLFVLGIILGTFLCEYCIGYSGEKVNIYGDFVLRTLKCENLNKVDLLIYIFVYRIKELILLLVFGMTYIKSVLYSIYAGYAGMRFAMLLSVLTVMNKKMAILWFVLLNMPHTILYAIDIVWIINIFIEEKKERFIYGRRVTPAKAYFLICIIYFTGIITEVFINPILIRRI